MQRLIGLVGAFFFAACGGATEEETEQRPAEAVTPVCYNDGDDIPDECLPGVYEHYNPHLSGSGVSGKKEQAQVTSPNWKICTDATASSARNGTTTACCHGVRYCYVEHEWPDFRDPSLFLHSCAAGATCIRGDASDSPLDWRISFNIAETRPDWMNKPLMCATVKSQHPISVEQSLNECGLSRNIHMYGPGPSYHRTLCVRPNRGERIWQHGSIATQTTAYGGNGCGLVVSF